MFIKRQKCTKEDGSFFTPEDFVVGDVVTMYGRAIYLVDCDSFTREFCTAKLGREQGAALGYPDDPVDKYRQTFGIGRGRPGGEGGRRGWGQGLG